jgi:hypothetical protein
MSFVRERTSFTPAGLEKTSLLHTAIFRPVLILSVESVPKIYISDALKL